MAGRPAGRHPPGGEPMPRRGRRSSRPPPCGPDSPSAENHQAVQLHIPRIANAATRASIGRNSPPFVPSSIMRVIRLSTRRLVSRCTAARSSGSSSSLRSSSLKWVCGSVTHITSCRAASARRSVCVRSGVLSKLREDRRRALRDAADKRVEQRLLAREIIVHRSAAQPDLVGDVLQAGGREAAGGEQGGRLVEHLRGQHVAPGAVALPGLAGWGDDFQRGRRLGWHGTTCQGDGCRVKSGHRARL